MLAKPAGRLMATAARRGLLGGSRPWLVVLVLLVGVGTVLLALGALRGLQAWGEMDGRWSWVPYLAAALPLALAGMRAASLIGKSGRSHG